MKKLFRTSVIPALITALVLLSSCTNNKTTQDVKPGAPTVNAEWTKDAVLYELNVRQFTDEGTFAAAENHVARLKDLGVDVIWFMPVHPIGEINRKGPLGSYYSVADFRDVNPEFGTMEEFMSLVDTIHKAGMHVIMDWVPNHSAWDNPLMEEHPEWYKKDDKGEFISPYDWTDVVQFDWENMDLQDYMVDALVYWVRDVGIDGYRVDHPHVTPADFWLRARIEMEKVKPVLMLAENEDRVEFFQNGFDMNYSWELHHLMNEVAQGKKKYTVLDEALHKDFEHFPAGAMRMRFITNHDENSWAGTIEERMGDAGRAFAVFMYTIPGTPLIYNGQEVGLNKRLKFFERDPIVWDGSPLTAFYTKLNALKADNPALYNGAWGGSFETITIQDTKDVYAYKREKGDNVVLTIINFSDEMVSFKIDNTLVYGDYTDLFTDDQITVDAETSFDLGKWGYIVLTR